MTTSIHIDPSDPTPRALKDHCEDHPEQTAENCQGGFGLAGGGFGAYSICGVCGCIFNKFIFEDD